MLCFSVIVFAGEVITNDTGEDATGLRVAFSTPVLITALGDIFTSVDPQMLSFEFVFSGGVVAPWESHWFNYAPATASVVEYEWLTDLVTAEAPPGSLPSNGVLPLGRAPTYAEIMAEIAEYPGEDEPLYEPAPDEAIWLTDLEGHANIYDNDSIKINYADWFDKSQISGISINRNGIEMRFLPDMLNVDVLTNEQMKTFDGNPAEHTPASDHTDHAITGYEYSVSTLGSSDQVLSTTSARVLSRSLYREGYRFANIGHLWYEPFIDGFSDSHARRFLEKVLMLGFDGISLEVNYFLGGSSLDQIFPQYTEDFDVHPWLLTANPRNVRQMCRLAKSVGLQVDLRFSIWISEEAKQRSAFTLDRCCFIPPSPESFFASYSSRATDLARIGEDEGADYFTAIIELHGLMGYPTYIRDLLDEIDSVFSGRLIVEDHISMILEGLHELGLEGEADELAQRLGSFWDWADSEGNPLIIGLNPWPLKAIFESQSDQRYSEISTNIVSHWGWAVQWFRDNYPGHQIVFAEVGAFNVNGCAEDCWGLVNTGKCERDDQELADIWRGYFDAITALKLDGASMWAFSYYAHTVSNEPRACRVYLNNTLAELTLVDFLR